MPRVCPRPCGRLTTAAVFISIGVVQLLVGIILLRSKFADLLAGPDFMTASSNVGIGCVYGMAATVWKSKKKMNPTKENAKNNVLMSLLVSLIAVNATTFAVLIIGEGSKLLTTYMETRHQEFSASLANEVLAGAYITSVCSPIVCIVVAIVALSGICFQKRGIKQQNHVRSVLNIGTSFDWNPKSRPSHDDIETPYTDSSPDTDDNVFSEKSHRKFKLSDRFFSSPPGRRDSNLVRNSNFLKKRSPLFSSSLPKIERSDKELIPRIKKSSFLKKSSRLSQSDEALSYCDSVKVTREKSSTRDFKSEKEVSGVSRCTTRSQSTEDAFRKGSIDKTEHFFPNDSRSSYTKNVSFEGVNKGTPVYSKTFASPQIDDPGVSDIEEEPINPPCMKLRIETLKELKTRIKSIPTLEPTEFLKNPPIRIINQEARSLGKAVPIPNVPSVDYERTDSSGNGDSETSEGSTRSARNRSSPSDSFSASHAFSAEVRTPDALQHAKRVHATIMNGIRSKSLSTPPMESNLDDHSSISVGRERKNLVLDNPKVPSITQQTRKRDVTKRMASMESISEVSLEEFGNTKERTPGKLRLSSNKARDVDQMITDENSNITDLKGPLRKCQSGTGKSKKQANPSIKNRLKGIWSSSAETKMDILELIMDQDSLIGLSEDELMSRTRRIRELRKTVAERLKSELKDSEVSKSLNESSNS